MIIISVILIIVVALYLIYSYNSVVNSKQKVGESWSGIDVQLKRRYDLIPNLVKVVGEYEKFEKNILEQVTQLRANALAINQNDVKEKSGVEKDISSSLRSLFAVAEAYPDLKASSEFLNLQKQLTIAEDEIASARRIYNENVANYNSHIKMFPFNLVANTMGFKDAAYFQNES